MSSRTRLRALAALALALGASGTVPDAAAEAAGAGEARLVPLPRPPAGPQLKRVRHDARQPLRAGDSVRVAIVGEPKATVTARLGDEGDPVPCPASPDRPDLYACTLVIPEKLSGRRHVVAEATARASGRSRLSSLVPVEIVIPDPRAEVDALNVRLAPIYFAPGSSEIDEAAREALSRSVPVLESHPRLPIVVEGHCDAGEGGDPEALTRSRAEAVVGELASRGIARERMTASAKACAEPVAPTGDEEARALNRRAMILFGLAESPEGD